MKKWFSKLSLVLLCVVIAAETLYIVTFPCTWGYSLYVDDVLVGSLNDKNQLLEILDGIKAPYITENTQSCEFLESIKIQREKFLKEQLMKSTVEQIASKLNQNKKEATLYKVRRGDTWSEIAEKHGQTSLELLGKNPGYNINKLKVGDHIVVTSAVPFISVMTLEQQTYEQAIPYETVYLNNEKPLLDFSRSRMIQLGTCGTAEVTANITCINGVETNREIISSIILIEPINEVRQIIPE